MITESLLIPGSRLIVTDLKLPRSAGEYMSRPVPPAACNWQRSSNNRNEARAVRQGADKESPFVSEVPDAAGTRVHRVKRQAFRAQRERGVQQLNRDRLKGGRSARLNNIESRSHFYDQCPIELQHDSEIGFGRISRDVMRDGQIDHR